MADGPPSQSSIDALNTTTPNYGYLPQRTSTCERPFTHQGNYLVVSVTFTVGEDEANTAGLAETDFSSELIETLKIILSYK